MSLLAFVASAQTLNVEQSVFDAHVHLREGEASFLDYEAEVSKAGIKLGV